MPESSVEQGVRAPSFDVEAIARDRLVAKCKQLLKDTLDGKLSDDDFRSQVESLPEDVQLEAAQGLLEDEVAFATAVRSFRLGADPAAWAQLYHHGLPAICVSDPTNPAGMPVSEQDGWVGPAQAYTCVRPDGTLGRPNEGWRAEYTPGKQRLVIRKPSGEVWFSGGLSAAADWRRVLRSTDGVVLLIAGQFRGPDELLDAAGRGALRLLVAQLSYVGIGW